MASSPAAIIWDETTSLKYFFVVHAHFSSKFEGVGMANSADQITPPVVFDLAAFA